MSYTDPSSAGSPAAGQPIEVQWGLDVQQDIESFHYGSPAGGDLGGTYPNPKVVALQGIAVSQTAPVANDALVYNGTAWAPASTVGGGGVTWQNFSLAGGWSNIAGNTPAQYAPDLNGWISLRGSGVYSGTINAGQTVQIGTLPSGMRPTGTEAFGPVQLATYITITSAGAVNFVNAVTNTSSLTNPGFTLSGIRFTTN